MKNLLAFKRKPAEAQMLPFKRENHLNSLSPEALSDLLKSSEGRTVAKLMPTLKGKKVLLVAPGPRNFVKQVLEDESPEAIVQLQFEPGSKPPQDGDRVFRADPQRLGIRQNHFDVVIACLSDYGSPVLSHLSPLTEALKAGGTFILAARHPSLCLIMKDPASDGIGMQDYFQEMRQCQLYLENLKEGVVQNEVKPYLTMARNDPHFGDYVGIPLVVCFRFVKYVPTEH